MEEKDRLQKNVGGPTSAHNHAWSKCQALMNQTQHIETLYSRQSEQARMEYRIRLTATVACVRFLFRQGLAFCAHGKSKSLLNQVNLLELLKFLVDHNQSIHNVVLNNTPKQILK